jgi:hypothetical protein
MAASVAALPSSIVQVGELSWNMNGVVVVFWDGAPVGDGGVVRGAAHYATWQQAALACKAAVCELIKQRGPGQEANEGHVAVGRDGTGRGGALGGFR